ncbi:DNA adenine methylase [Treponema phagedenis]|nr:hypothetical protein HMPREF9554_01724 [Treponema phagedenis F0421]QSH93980.1 methyltransferase [Treponema phagedenis]QSH99521.1 DNA adenine methylase [Treponema phagedenis]
MKTPLSYYGGKQQLAKKIIKLVLEHKIYKTQQTASKSTKK